ncbi:MAG: hypothetical protein HYT43_00160 [Candidatus Taylorbacteria bacterium]|nr:hypothetical protein [Candidatus Taylorbacteria bacterium]
MKTKNMTAILEREELPEIDPEKLVARNVLDYARDKLDYRHPNAIAQNEETTLCTALRTAGIRPLNEKSVERYKTEMLHKHSPSWVSRSMAYEEPVPLYVFGSFAAAGVMAAMVVLVAGGVYLWADKVDSARIGLIILKSTIIFLGCGTVATLMAFLAGIGRRVCGWKTLSLGEYSRLKKAVPEFALQTAVEVHQRSGGKVFFFVEEFEVERRVMDPFLIAQGPEGDTYYLEVWDEPGFKRKRKA